MKKLFRVLQALWLFCSYLFWPQINHRVREYQNAEKISAAAKEMISINCLRNISFFVARNNVNVSLPIIITQQLSDEAVKFLTENMFEYLKTPSRSQIIVTTHNDGLLDLVDDLIRKESMCRWKTDRSHQKGRRE